MTTKSSGFTVLALSPSNNPGGSCLHWKGIALLYYSSDGKWEKFPTKANLTQINTSSVACKFLSNAREAFYFSFFCRVLHSSFVAVFYSSSVILYLKLLISIFFAIAYLFCNDRQLIDFIALLCDAMGLAIKWSLLTCVLEYFARKVETIVLCVTCLIWKTSFSQDTIIVGQECEQWLTSISHLHKLLWVAEGKTLA